MVVIVHARAKPNYRSVLRSNLGHREVENNRENIQGKPPNCGPGIKVTVDRLKLTSTPTVQHKTYGNAASSLTDISPLGTRAWDLLGNRRFSTGNMIFSTF